MPYNDSADLIMLEHRKWMDAFGTGRDVSPKSSVPGKFSMRRIKRRSSFSYNEENDFHCISSGDVRRESLWDVLLRLLRSIFQGQTHSPLEKN